MTNQLESAYNLILQRRSCRSYTSSPVSQNQIDKLLRAAYNAPCAAADSRQYTVVQSKDMLARINQEAKAAALRLNVSRLMELALNRDYSCLHNAPVAIIISGSKQSVAPESDCAAAAQNILLAALSLGLGSCWIFFPILAFEAQDGPALLSALSIPEDYKPHAVVVVGHPNSSFSGISERTEPVVFI